MIESFYKKNEHLRAMQLGKVIQYINSITTITEEAKKKLINSLHDINSLLSTIERKKNEISLSVNQQNNKKSILGNIDSLTTANKKVENSSFSQESTKQNSKTNNIETNERLKKRQEKINYLYIDIDKLIKKINS